LQAGDLVPADIKLSEAKNLQVDEFDLTGEILPVKKEIDEKGIFVYRGSKVTGGWGKGVVFAVGDETEFGKILKQRWGQTKFEFPALVRAKYLVMLVFLLPPLFAIGYYVNLAVAGLVFVVSVLLVLFLQNSALFKYLVVLNELKALERKNIHLQDQTALDKLSQVDVVCFDKTGVLTTRELKVKAIHYLDSTPDLDDFASNNGAFGLTNLACALCNDVIVLERINQSNPIDRALISFAEKNGVNLKDLLGEYRRIYQKPFESEERYMVSGFASGDKKLFFAKGDPEIIRKMCKNYVASSNEEKKFDLDAVSQFKFKTSSTDNSGDRTIALAYSSGTSEAPPAEFTFLCIVQFENPLRPNAREIVEALKKEGIRSVMVTGDRPETALKISKATAIDDSDFSLIGRALDQMGFSEIARQSDYISVYSRMLPSQKATLVRMLQQRNHAVVMVGDGANDTIALKVADVGVSFSENSSPFAKRVSKVLINDLIDILMVIKSAKRVKSRLKSLFVLRSLVLASLFLFLYWLTLTLFLGGS
jgi:Ca2+-transporting ATPase